MQMPLRVLIVEDNRSDALLEVELLKEAGFALDWRWAASEEEFLEAIEQSYDVILADYSLPQFDALLALKHLKERGDETPLLIVSGSIGEDLAVAAMRAGACDYLLKDRLGRLGSAVSHALEMQRIRRDKQRAEEMVRLLQRGIETGDDGFVLVDSLAGELPMLYVNQAFSQITGYSDEELLGRNWNLLAGPQTDITLHRNVLEDIKHGRAGRSEILHYRKDGTTFWNEVTISPVTGIGGKVTHSVCVHSDITEKKELQQQLLQSQKMEAIGRLAGGIAHDFNNLLTVILGCSEVLLDTPPGDGQTEMIQGIQRAGERAVSLTRQLLLFSRKHVAAPVVIDLNEIVTRSHLLFGRVVGEDIVLTTDLSPQSCYVRADPSQLEQVLMNLVVNARDAMPQGGQLSLRTELLPPEENAAQSGSQVLLQVTDTGCGMTAEVRSRIFEPFFTTKDAGEGSGLGLSIVFGVIKQCGGNIHVQSNPGWGTRFSIRLPAVVTESPALTPANDRALLRGTETILLAEDDHNVRAFTRMALESLGYRVLEAANGAAALACANSHAGEIDLLLTDIIMPHMSGPELARQMDALKPKIKVLFVTGYTDEALERQGLSGDQVAILYKPFSISALARKLRQVLGGTNQMV